MTTPPVATDTQEPTDEQTPGSEPVTPPAQEPSDEATRTMPDKAYIGLQRRLSAKDSELTALEGQLADAQRELAQPGRIDTETQQAVTGLIELIKQADPEKGAAAEAATRVWMSQREVAAYRLADEERDTASALETISQDNVSALQELASNMGADPDSPLIDYGSDNEPFSVRMERVMESARSAVEPAEPVTPPPVSAAETHATQPGVAIAPASEPETVTIEQVRAAISERGSARTSAERAEATRKFEDLQARFEAQASATK